MNFDLSCVFQGLGSIGALYISNFKTANNFSALQKLNIKAVITAAKGRRIDYSKTKISKYLYLDIEDYENFNISKYFDQAFDFIEEARKSSNVLIHCHIGASRSVAIVIAYLIRKYNYSLPQIYALIKRKRSKIQPNPGFIKQLQRYSQKYGIQNIQLNISRSQPKTKVLRSVSMCTSIKSSTFQFEQNSRQIKSQELKQKSCKTETHGQLFKEQKQKIEELHKQRQQIQYKLRNLRHGLIKSGDLQRKKQFSASEVKMANIEIKNVEVLKIDQNIQNSNPNRMQQLSLDPLIQKPSMPMRGLNKFHKVQNQICFNKESKLLKKTQKQVSLYSIDFENISTSFTAPISSK